MLGPAPNPATEETPINPVEHVSWRPHHEQMIADAHSDALRTAITDGNMKVVQREAHTLKGMCGNLGAMAMVNLFGVLEQRSSPLSVEEMKSVFGNVETEFERVRDALATER